MSESLHKRCIKILASARHVATYRELNCDDDFESVEEYWWTDSRFKVSHDEAHECAVMLMIFFSACGDTADVLYPQGTHSFIEFGVAYDQEFPPKHMRAISRSLAS